MHRLFMFVGMVIVLALLAPSTVSAHAEVVSSVPAANARLATAPNSITIVFSEELKPTGNSIVVTDSAGTRVDNNDTALVRTDADRKTIRASLRAPLPAGTYAVAWENASVDGHTEKGTYTFAVGSTAPTILPATGGASDLRELVLFAGTLIALGCALRRRHHA